jgi:hypothetical protein
VFLRHLLGITKLDKEKNQTIREKLGVQNIVNEIKQYQQKWLQHIQRMDTNRIPKQVSFVFNNKQLKVYAQKKQP